MQPIAGSPVVLVADDDDIVRALAVRALEKAGCRVLRTGDGLETLRVIARTKPDLVVLDIGMPGIDGKAVMRIVGKMGADAPVVIFLTAETSDEGRTEGLALGAADYITKPFRPRDLAQRVGAALSARAA
jgi:two-component system phosphate regulon response regulator OmpR